MYSTKSIRTEKIWCKNNGAKSILLWMNQCFMLSWFSCLFSNLIKLYMLCIHINSFVQFVNKQNNHDNAQKIARIKPLTMIHAVQKKVKRKQIQKRLENFIVYMLQCVGSCRICMFTFILPSFFRNFIKRMLIIVGRSYFVKF